MARTFAAIALIVVLIIGGGVIATTAYQAGLTAEVTTTTVDGGTAVVAPVVYHGWGWGFGFPFFGLIAGLFLFFLVIGLVRAVFFGWGGPRRWGGPPPGWGPGRGGLDPATSSRWASHAHDTFEAWHREAHERPTGGAEAGRSS
jgi:hypothetical protein